MVLGNELSGACGKSLTMIRISGCTIVLLVWEDLTVMDYVKIHQWNLLGRWFKGWPFMHGGWLAFQNIAKRWDGLWRYARFQVFFERKYTDGSKLYEMNRGYYQFTSREGNGPGLKEVYGDEESREMWA